MEILENINTILSIILGIGSIVMFLLSKNEKEECKKIKNEINNLLSQHKNEQLNEINGNKNIVTNDSYNINEVKTFDNRKSIK